MFESIISLRLRRYLEDNSLLTTKQFGFRPHRSTQDALNIMTACLSNSADRRMKTVLVTKDVEQAFDTVWHTGLRYKICTKFNFPSLTQRLLCNFFDERKLKLKFLNQISDTITLHAGVPQGSSLSPTLYAMYTTDIPDPINDSSLTILYADDCTHITRCNTLTGVVRRMNRELDLVSRWEHNWRIKTNPGKTKVLHIKPRRCDENIDPIYINQYDRPLAPLATVDNCKVLGLTFDRQLRFHIQATRKVQQARAALHTLYRFRCADIKTKNHLYQAMVKPHLTYAPMALLLSAPTHRKSLQTVQNKALRWIYNVRWEDYISNHTLHQRAKTLTLNTTWNRQLKRSLMKMNTWNNEWIEKIEQLASTNIRTGLSCNYLTYYLTLEEPD